MYIIELKSNELLLNLILPFCSYVHTYVFSCHQVAFDSVPRDISTPAPAVLAVNRLGELSSAYINQIQRDWYYCVAKYKGYDATRPQCG
jgi:hypothetical protein